MFIGTIFAAAVEIAAHARFATETKAYIWYRVNHEVAVWMCTPPRPHAVAFSCPAFAALHFAALAATVAVPVI